MVPCHAGRRPLYAHVTRGDALSYRGLILDFGGVLTTRMRLNGEAFERSEGLTPGAYFHALEEHPDGVRVYADLEVGRATQEEWNHVIGGILGIDPTDLMRRALANLRPEPAIVAAAERARSAGIKVALLSNSFGLEPFNPYKQLGMYQDFDAVVLSEVERVRKPSAAIYQRTLAALDLTGPECVFVDDHAKNLPPAEALGITTIHHTDAAVTAARLDELLFQSATRTATQ
ncbi:HAD-superfamily hydrolase subfamily IA, variant 3 [Streptomyces formicae]|uniref:HAD-superfamily hydrolase subfamily IA, variant 3 n=1 Tax=Streptomyces formicae TaxID=1616117 RepID=A0A291QLC2_9ACTN|nr:HAD-superfamily hydrolase subfamily IA, variant 3 [Streptomyces formicae]